jgi:uncharacterized protein YjeT (DUF2065 family)
MPPLFWVWLAWMVGLFIGAFYKFAPKGWKAMLPALIALPPLAYLATLISVALYYSVAG